MDILEEGSHVFRSAKPGRYPENPSSGRRKGRKPEELTTRDLGNPTNPEFV